MVMGKLLLWAIVLVPIVAAWESSSLTRRQALQVASATTSGGLWLPASCSLADGTSAIGPLATLSDGTVFPRVSFGLQVYDDSTAYRLTLTALETGYRNLFASVLAGNQKGFAKAVKDSGIDRKDLFICGSVVSNRAQGLEAARRATARGCAANMAAFGVGGIDYLDQIMLDYPGPDKESIVGQWQAFQDMHDEKLVRTLAVSNFSPQQLCLVDAKVKPVVNQLPFSVAYHPGSVIADNRKRGLLVQAWAPLGGSLGGRFNSAIKGKCAEIGRRYNKSFAQVALRWIVQSGASFTTQSQNKSHFAENLDIFDFTLDEDEMTTLSALAL